MRGILNKTFNFVDMNCGGGSEDELIMQFDEGDEVEILKVIDNANSYESTIAYVIFNIKNLESVTIDSNLVDLIEGEV